MEGKELDPNEDLVNVQRWHEIYFWQYLCEVMCDEMCAQAAGHEGILYCGGSAAAQNWTSSAHQREGKSHICELHCCVSGMLIPDPNFNHPGSNKKREGKDIFVLLFLATNFSKLKINLFFDRCRKNLRQLTKNNSTFQPNTGNCH
jgi:hypothetical protein